jgi:hypothetical protein
MLVNYKTTYPNGKIYVGKDLTDMLAVRRAIQRELL